MKIRTPSDGSLRSKAARRGFKLIKIREDSRWYNHYGPFMISDAATNCAVQYGMTAEEADAWLTSDEPTPVIVGAGEALLRPASQTEAQVGEILHGSRGKRSGLPQIA